MSYHGPLLVTTREEVTRIYDALRFERDPAAVSLTAKCVAVLEADPQWRRPLR